MKISQFFKFPNKNHFCAAGIILVKCTQMVALQIITKMTLTDMIFRQIIKQQPSQ